MCTTCGCVDAVHLAGVESVKAGSTQLRGTIAAELGEDTARFSEDAGHILKFHGVYQQDDRDRRRDARRLGLDKQLYMHNVLLDDIPDVITGPRSEERRVG